MSNTAISNSEQIEENTRTVESLGWAIVALVNGDYEEDEAISDIGMHICRLSKEAKSSARLLLDAYKEANNKVEALEKELKIIKSRLQDSL